MSDQKRYDLEAICAANPIPAVLAARGVALKEMTGRESGNKWSGCCPVHRGDNKRAFVVTADGREWYCRTGCQHGGDVIRLVMELDGLTFLKACEKLGGKAVTLTTPRPQPKRTTPAPAPPLPELDASKRREMERLVDRLAGDRGVIEDLANSRDWEPVTISALACTGALGWIDRCPGADGWLCFIYPHAIKVRGLWRNGDSWRWHRPDGKRTISWLWEGWPWNGAELWREDRLRLLLHTRAILCEGEPDVISMIDAEANDYETTVVGIPSAAAGVKLKARLPDLFAGLHVVFSADEDDAGQKALRDLGPIIQTTATSFAHISPADLAYAS